MLDNTTVSGLNADEAACRLAEHGPDRLTPFSKRGPLLRFLLQFQSVLIYVLLAATFVTALLAYWVDTAVIIGVVVINAVIGFIQVRRISFVPVLLALGTIALFLLALARGDSLETARIVAVNALVMGEIA